MDIVDYLTAGLFYMDIYIYLYKYIQKYMYVCYLYRQHSRCSQRCFLQSKWRNKDPFDIFWDFFEMKERRRFCHWIFQMVRLKGLFMNQLSKHLINDVLRSFLSLLWLKFFNSSVFQYIQQLWCDLLVVTVVITVMWLLF